MDIIELHNIAMDKADEADRAKMSANNDIALALYQDAYEKEREAAYSSLAKGIGEPTTSILFKSAAFLAYDAGLLRESEQLACQALSLNLCDEIADELRDLLENINFGRHLRLNGISLSDNEFQIVVAGNGVAHGMARESDVNSRISAIKQLAIRTIERHQGKSFRTKGKPTREVASFGEAFLSVPRAASYAVTIRLGASTPSLFGDSVQSSSNALIEDLATNLSLINSDDFTTLRERINDQAYLENFVSQAKEFAPDGVNVSVVGITYMREGKEVPIQFTKCRKEFKSLSEFVFSPSKDEDETKSIKKETLCGQLSAADSTSNNVKIKPTEGKIITVNVPEGLADIVKKYFDDTVTLSVLHNTVDNSYKLLSVDPLEDESSLF